MAVSSSPSVVVSVEDRSSIFVLTLLNANQPDAPMAINVMAKSNRTMCLVPKRALILSLHRGEVNGRFREKTRFLERQDSEPEEFGAGFGLKPLIPGNHAIGHHASQRKQELRGQQRLGLDHAPELFVGHEQQCAVA